MKCPNCGKETIPGALYCTGCGGRLDTVHDDEAGAEKPVGEDVLDEKDEASSEKNDKEAKTFSRVDEVEEPFPCNPVGLNNDGENVDDCLDEHTADNGTYAENDDVADDVGFEAVPAKKNSKIEQRRIIRRLRPLGTWSFFWRDALSLIPLVNIVVMFVFAFADGINENSKAFARAKLIRYLLVFIVFAVGFVLCWIFRYQISAWLKTFIRL